MSETPDNLEAIFDAALELPTEERPAYLTQACAGNEDLKRRILPELATGEKLCGVAFAHLRRPGPPILRAISVSESRSGMTATLCGIEQLKPAHPIARAPRTASPSPSGATSQLM